MQLSTTELSIIPLNERQLGLLCRGRALLEDELGLEHTSEQRDSHLDAAYAEMLAMCRANPAAYLWFTNWQIVLKAENTAIGSIGFLGASDENGSVEVGYGIDGGFRCRGFASQALAAVCEWAFAQGVKSVCAQTEPDNAPSKRVLEKCGFIRCGHGDEGELYLLRRKNNS